MTVVVVASGFIGRYIYTAVPRTADGVAIEAQELQVQLEAARTGSAGRVLAYPGTLVAVGHGSDAVALASGGGLPDARGLEELERQLSALRWARRALATWHAIHIPLGMALFVMAAAHVVAAVYYASLLR
jgi:hypothetical protein